MGLINTDYLHKEDARIAQFSNTTEDQGPETVLTWAMETFGDKFVIVSSFQAEGMVILDIARRINPDVRVMTIDTGRLHETTYAFMDQVRDHYNTKIEVIFPDAGDVRDLVTQNGTNLFYKEVSYRLECCYVRKVKPLQNALRGEEAWATGLRREQSPTRAHIKKIELDHNHKGIIKLNPLADWTHEDVQGYIKIFDVPRHPLYEQGYTSIGCAPCTRETRPDEDPRAGRWWWEEKTRKECGLHDRT